MAKEYIEKSEVLRAIARSNSINDAYKLVDGIEGLMVRKDENTATIIVKNSSQDLQRS